MKLRPLTVIGLNSGTSMDGIDAAVFRIVPDKPADDALRPKLKIEMLGAILHEFQSPLRRKMKSLIGSGRAELEEVCRLDAALGEEFSAAVLALLRSSGLAASQVNLIGSHGQTIWHAPQEKSFAGVVCSNTLQLGQPSVIAERTRIPVIGDFRVADMAAGGQGAPLVAFADELLFAEVGSGIAILNIGGIANMTALDRSGQALLAFDTGPGNMLIDRACERLFSVEFDNGGAIAARGKIDEKWLQQILQTAYFAVPPPKTTGRELFGLPFADDLISEGQKRGLNNESIVATVSALTSASIADQYKRFIQERVPINKIVLGGGGADNKFLVEQLCKYWPGKLETSRHEDYGISTKFKEALLFAILAYTTHFRIPNNVPACTGARRRVCMGKLCSP